MSMDRRPYDRPRFGVDFKVIRNRLVLLLKLLFAAGSISAQPASLGTPDAIFYNGKVVTVDSGFSIQQAFAIKGEQFVAVGANAKVRALAGKSTRIVDLH